MNERILFIGDTKGIRIQDIYPFVQVAHCLYGGSFPSHEEGLPDTIVAEQTCRLLTEVGIPDPSPLVICGSTQERAKQILQYCTRRNRQHGEGLYVVIDKDPDSLARAAKLVVTNDNPSQGEILKSIAVIRLGAERGSDHVDTETGLRVTVLPHPFNPFPTHPTPAS